MGPLTNLNKFLRTYPKPETWGNRMEEHFCYDLMRYPPKPK